MGGQAGGWPSTLQSPFPSDALTTALSADLSLTPPHLLG
jgi:hypothetical protein